MGLGFSRPQARTEVLCWLGAEFLISLADKLYTSRWRLNCCELLRQRAMVFALLLSVKLATVRNARDNVFTEHAEMVLALPLHKPQRCVTRHGNQDPLADEAAWLKWKDAQASTMLPSTNVMC